MRRALILIISLSLLSFGSGYALDHLRQRTAEQYLAHTEEVRQLALAARWQEAQAQARLIYARWQQDERLMLVIEDDGSGLPPGSGQQGFGLTGMRERVTALGGTLHISCLHGTRVSVSLPQRYV